MRWYYRLIEKGVGFYLYAYSRESKKYDGVIRYDTVMEHATIESPCADDLDSEWSKGKALEHFWKVINDNFPEERSVCCG